MSMNDLTARLTNAWIGRISGCQLGKPVELLSMRKGYEELQRYLQDSQSLPLRDYVKFLPDRRVAAASCREHIVRSEPDDDINYSVLELELLEEHGLGLSTEDVARSWLKRLPAASTFTAERMAYRTLLMHCDEWFAEGKPPGFDLALCSDNAYNLWIGAQIRADVYGWVCPGQPSLAADLARRDAELSHREDGVYGAMFVAALGAALATMSPDEAFTAALAEVPDDSDTAAAARFGYEHAGNAEAGELIRDRYPSLSPVATVNNLCVVVWALYSHLEDFGAAIGEAVCAGWDTDCNGATVGALWGLQGGEIPHSWSAPWQGQVGLSLAGLNEVTVTELVERTVAVTQLLSGTNESD